MIYLPFLQQAFSTAALTLGDWLTCMAVAQLGALGERAGEGREAGRRPPRGGPSVTIR